MKETAVDGSFSSENAAPFHPSGKDNNGTNVVAQPYLKIMAAIVPLNCIPLVVYRKNLVKSHDAAKPNWKLVPYFWPKCHKPNSK